jgi:hypothetical protein
MPELACEKVEDHYVLRDGAAGLFLAASQFPRHRETRAPLLRELLPHREEIDPKYSFLFDAPGGGWRWQSGADPLQPQDQGAVRDDRGRRQGHRVESLLSRWSLGAGAGARGTRTPPVSERLSANRGYANQALFQARVLLDVWAATAAEPPRSAAVLEASFAPAVLLHLRRAYGWFLLTISGSGEVREPRELPASVEELPAPPPGRVAPPELREFALLERDGWLGALLQADELACLGQAGGHPLLASDRARPDRATLSAWLESLAALMARMGDSLDEC